MDDDDREPSAAGATRQLRLTIEYDGTELGGWQRQPNAPTVQAHLERALATMLQHEVRVTGASRTDAGVHALGQVATFQTVRTIPVHGLRRGLNGLLPPAIAVTDVAEVPADFHPRFSASGKHYQYLVVNRADRSPRWARWAWHRPEALDHAAMAEAARGFIGRHDFAGFRATGCAARTTTRTLHRVEIGPRMGDPDVLAIDVEGDAFLRNMVRILVGTLLGVGEGRLAAAQIAEIIASRDRRRAGQTAPAHGLTLVAVRYDGRLRGPAPPPGV